MGKVSEVMVHIKENVAQLKELNDSMPIEMDNIIRTLVEMENGCGPDAEADYWDQKEMIKRL